MFQFCYLPILLIATIFLPNIARTAGEDTQSEKNTKEETLPTQPSSPAPSSTGAGEHYFDFSDWQVIDDCLVGSHTPSCYQKMSTVLDWITNHSECENIRGIRISKGFISEKSLGSLACYEIGINRCSNLAVLDLSNCSITANAFINDKHSHDSDIKRYVGALLCKPSFFFLDIVGNYAASIDIKPFFNRLPEVQLLKIIWIPEGWIEGYGWTNVCCSPERLKDPCDLQSKPLDAEELSDLGIDIEDAHRGYYNTYHSKWQPVPLTSQKFFQEQYQTESDWRQIRETLKTKALDVLREKGSIELNMHLRRIDKLETEKKPTRDTKQKLAELFFKGMVFSILTDDQRSFARQIFLHLLSDTPDSFPEEMPGLKEYYQARIQDVERHGGKAYELYKESANKGYSAAQAEVLRLEEDMP